MRIAFIGYGEAARAFTDSLHRAKADLTISAWDIEDEKAMGAAMTERGVRQGADAGDAVEGADWIVNAVTADQSLVATRSVLPHLVAGQTLFDINSVSPGRKREAASCVEEAGAAYLDMAVMAPVHPRGHATPVLLAGREATGLAPDLAELGFSYQVVGDEPGEATAVKMVRSLFVKGLEAITVETLLAASASGCFDRVLASLTQSFPGLGWPDNAAYNFERALRHGTRRAAEMRESAATLDALGLHGALAAEVAAIQERMGAVAPDDLPEGSLADGVAAILRECRENDGSRAS